MRKIIFTILLIFTTGTCIIFSQELKLPIVFHNSYNVHNHTMFGFPISNQVSDKSSFVKQLKNYTDIRVGNISIYLSAITSVWDNSFRNTFNYAFVKDRNGNERLIIDANNNHDFSDDKIFIADTIYMEKRKPIAQVSNIKVEYDWAEKNRKVKKYIDVVIVYNEAIKMYLYSFIHYGTTDFFGKKLDIISQKDLTYDNFRVYTDTARLSSGLSINKYLDHNQIVYRIKEVDINNKLLILEKEKFGLSETTSAQTGYKAPLFSEPEWFSKDTISLEKYKGKYVFIDFWAVWCSPCIEELPKLQALYEKVNHNKIAFISVVSKDLPNRIKEVVIMTGLNYPLVEANYENKILSKYRVKQFPTMIFIDPTGAVIKAEFRANELEIMLKQYDLLN